MTTMRGFRRTTAAFGALAVGAMLLTGCGALEQRAQAEQQQVRQSPAPSDVDSTPSGVAPASGGGDAQTPVEPDHGDGPCTLSVSLGQQDGGFDGAQGTAAWPLLYTNTGGSTCTVSGLPRVMFVAGDDGAQVGPEAELVDKPDEYLTLAPGETANTELTIGGSDNFDPAECQATEVRGLRVYPPHSDQASFVSLPMTACAGELSEPFSQLSVDPATKWQTY